MNAARWAVARELRPDGGWNEVVARVIASETLLVGREGDLPLGVDPEDNGISRVALDISATEQGWRIDVGNRGGARIYPWGLAASPAQTHQSLDWPLIAVRVRCPTADHQHWVLLQARPFDDAPPTLPPRGVSTTTGERPKPLTVAELEALRLLFADFLAWPPRPSATPLQLKQVARQLGVSESAVQERLNGAVAKARRLGLDRPVRLTEPEYLHVLVGAGYVPPPALDVDRGVSEP